MNGRRCMRRREFPAVRSVALLLLLLALPAGPAEARDPFSGYVGEVAIQARRVVEAAAPGNEKALAGEVRLLRKAMLSRGILSINALPDLVFESAVQGRWKKQAGGILRIVAPVSALSVPMWAWLVKDDISRFNLGMLLDDMAGLAGAVRQFGPALLGYAAWVLSLFSAAACWYAAWAGAALYLRGRPALEVDVTRLLNKTARAEYLAPVAGALVFLLPAVAGAGIAIAAPIWLLVVTLYLRRRELLIMTVAIALLAGVVAGGGIIQTLADLEEGSGRARWLAAEGYPLDGVEPTRRGPVDLLASEPRSWIERFESARARTQMGDASAAERAWTSLLEEGKEVTEVLNNRGIARLRQGKVGPALADFEEAISRDPGHGPALWNSYQIYLQQFNIERARMVQPLAWERIQELEPYRFRPADMEQGEWVASPLPVPEIWTGYLESGRPWLGAEVDGSSFRPFFRPLSSRGTLVFLGVTFLIAIGARLVTRKRWVSGTCRACGVHLMISGSREAADVCTTCRSQVGGGVREGEEKDHRHLTIVMHRRFVHFASIAVPGSGSLWAGKEIRAMIYGMALSVALAAVSVSLAGARSGSALITELQSVVAVWAQAATAILWIAGAVWGIWSFAELQGRCNISGIKVKR